MARPVLATPLTPSQKSVDSPPRCNLITQIRFRQRAVHIASDKGLPFHQGGRVMFRTGIRSTRSRHTNTTFRAGLAAVALVAAAAMALATDSALAAPPKGGAANLAMIGEPQTLDPMASTADLVSTIMQHVYEPLYTFDANWNVAPMLAGSMPAISKDGVVYTIP